MCWEKWAQSLNFSPNPSPRPRLLSSLGRDPLSLSTSQTSFRNHSDMFVQINAACYAYFMSNWQTSSQWQSLAKSLLIGEQHEICQNKQVAISLRQPSPSQSDFTCPSFNKLLAIYQLNWSPLSLMTSSHNVMTPLSGNYVRIMGFMSSWRWLFSARRILTFLAILSTFNHQNWLCKCN